MDDNKISYEITKWVPFATYLEFKYDTNFTLEILY